MFAKIGEQNKFTGARQDAIEKGKEFEVDGKTYKVSYAYTKDEEKQAAERKQCLMTSRWNDCRRSWSWTSRSCYGNQRLADDNQDERIGVWQMKTSNSRPAIAEFGVDPAGQIKDRKWTGSQALLDADKVGKDGVDAVVGQLTGMGSADAGPRMSVDAEAIKKLTHRW